MLRVAEERRGAPDWIGPDRTRSEGLATQEAFLPSHLASIHLTAVRYCLLAFAQIQGAAMRVCDVRTAVGAQLSELAFANRLWGFFRALIAEAVDGLQETLGPAGALVMSAIDERVQRFFVQALQLDEFTLRLEAAETGSIEA